MFAAALSGRRGRSVRLGTAALLTGALAATSAVTVLAAPASAGGDGEHSATMSLTSRTTGELTDGANFIHATGRAVKRTYDGKVVLSFPVRSYDFDRHVARLAGGVAYTGAGPDVSWSRLRVNFETHRITALVNGGSRVAILRVGSSWNRDAWGDNDAGLQLTRAGARTLNRAAAGAPFSAGDVFAGDSSGCGR
jgi:hypothetical protein